MKKNKGGAYALITYEYECWKCPDWHKTISESDEDFFQTINWLNVSVRDVKREKPKLHYNADKTIWLIPLPGNRGLLLSWPCRLFTILPWKTARWEFADYEGGSEEWNSEVLSYGRN